MMAIIEEMEKEKMEFLEKMCKDDREHELRLLQILGQMMVPQSPHSPSLYTPSTGTTTITNSISYRRDWNGLSVF